MPRTGAVAGGYTKKEKANGEGTKESWKKTRAKRLKAIAEGQEKARQRRKELGIQ